MDDVIIAGGGLAGLSCASVLVKSGLRVRLLESRSFLGGRTASWIQNGMQVESGLHKFLGIYRALPSLLRDSGVDHNDILTWVDEVDILNPGVSPAKIMLSPYHHPVGTLGSLFNNTHLVPLVEKAKLALFFTAGAAQCAADPLMLDQISIADYARQYGISEDVISQVFFTVTQAVLFLSADKFSAYAAFAPAVEALKNLLTLRVGAFNGGMSEVMIAPIAKAIAARGGQIIPNAPVAKLIVEANHVSGVALADGTELRATHTVLATPLHVAQDLLRDAFGTQPWCQSMLQLPTLSAATIQFELDEPLLPGDHTNFSSTELCCFAEQSHTTFSQLPGRLSAILYPPDQFISMPAEEVAQLAYHAADLLGLPLRKHATRYQIVNHPKDFYAMNPGTEALRPTQRTTVPGLSLAGDYTKQPFIASMEGAVLSGQYAADSILRPSR